jgi:hypothetical protein
LGLLTATVGLLLAWSTALTDERWMVRTTASAAGTLLLGHAIWAAGWWDVTAAAHPGTALVAISVIGVLLVALAGPASHVRTPAGWAPVWYGVGIAAVLAWPGLAVVGLQATSAESRPAWLAAFLTAMGAAVAGAGLLSQRHRWLLLPGTMLLAAASWVRLWDLGVGTPEAYTLPWAVLLLAFGAARVVRGTGQSMRELAPGLALGLVPSLLWVLHSPLTLRGILLGVSCLVLVLAGSRARWSGPLVYAGAVGLIEVIRLAAPYAAQGIPRWALLGTAGVLLVIVGITWERRLAEARGAWNYLTRLR